MGQALFQGQSTSVTREGQHSAWRSLDLGGWPPRRINWGAGEGGGEQHELLQVGSVQEGRPFVEEVGREGKEADRRGE